MYSVFIENIGNYSKFTLVFAVVYINCTADFDEMFERLKRKVGLKRKEREFYHRRYRFLGLGFSFL